MTRCSRKSFTYSCDILITEEVNHFQLLFKSFILMYTIHPKISLMVISRKTNEYYISKIYADQFDSNIE